VLLGKGRAVAVAAAATGVADALTPAVGVLLAAAEQAVNEYANKIHKANFANFIYFP
jgi:hypothetical protein